jgi:RNA polymerase sigma factor (sigma-70 family)
MDAPGGQRNEAPQRPSRPPEFTSSLFKKIVIGDREGWERLAVRVARYARRKCSYAGIPFQDSVDVGQDVCVDILRHVDSFRLELTGDNLHRWLRAITRAKIGDYFRIRARRAEGGPVGGAESELAAIPEPLREASELPADNEAQARILHGAMALVRARVFPETWEAFCSVTLENRDAKEVAAKLRITPHAVRDAVHRVRQLLKECATLLAKVRDDSA